MCRPMKNKLFLTQKRENVYDGEEKQKTGKGGDGMKEKLYTIELNDALKAGDECPFCYLERNLEQAAIEVVLGSSNMVKRYSGSDGQAGILQKAYKDDV